MMLGFTPIAAALRTVTRARSDDAHRLDAR
jgi:hypothetical protein